MRLIDSHCHLFFDALAKDEAGVLDRATGAGVTKMVNVGTSIEDSVKAVEQAARYDNVWASVGAHPHDGADFLDDERSVDKLLDLAGRPKVVAIGEIGLDYFKDYVAREKQRSVLCAQLDATNQLGLPYIFHVRDAWDEFWPIIERYPKIKGVIHSFSADKDRLNEVLARGFMVGLNGIMTFTKEETQLEAAKAAPLNRLILETDSPFLAPKPFRGQTCEPMHIKTIAEFLAELRGESLEELAFATTKNAEELFGI
jgi:TatD DNase family protein